MSVVQERRLHHVYEHRLDRLRMKLAGARGETEAAGRRVAYEMAQIIGLEKQMAELDGWFASSAVDTVLLPSALARREALGSAAEFRRRRLQEEIEQERILHAIQRKLAGELVIVQRRSTAFEQLISTRWRDFSRSQEEAEQASPAHSWTLPQ
jgi:hypothetical protein